MLKHPCESGLLKLSAPSKSNFSVNYLALLVKLTLYNWMYSLHLYCHISSLSPSPCWMLDFNHFGTVICYVLLTQSTLPCTYEWWFIIIIICYLLVIFSVIVNSKPQNPMQTIRFPNWILKDLETPCGFLFLFLSIACGLNQMILQDLSHSLILQIPISVVPTVYCVTSTPQWTHGGNTECP